MFYEQYFAINTVQVNSALNHLSPTVIGHISPQTVTSFFLKFLVNWPFIPELPYFFSPATRSSGTRPLASRRWTTASSWRPSRAPTTPTTATSSSTSTASRTWPRRVRVPCPPWPTGGDGPRGTSGWTTSAPRTAAEGRSSFARTSH